MERRLLKTIERRLIMERRLLEIRTPPCVHLHSKVLHDEGNVQLLPCAQLPSKVLHDEGQRAAVALRTAAF